MRKIIGPRFRIEEPYKSLVNQRLPEHLDARQSAQARDQGRCMRAAPVYEVFDSPGAQFAKRCISGKAPAPPGPFRIPVDLISGIGVMNQI